MPKCSTKELITNTESSAADFDVVFKCRRRCALQINRKLLISGFYSFPSKKATSCVFEKFSENFDPRVSVDFLLRERLELKF